MCVCMYMYIHACAHVICMSVCLQSILHVSRTVDWLFHAVSSQQVSKEGFVSDGGIWVAT